MPAYKRILLKLSGEMLAEEAGFGIGAAAISRFAMKIGDRWQEGEVVERQAARVAYEDFLHRRQDPALDLGGVKERVR